MDISPELLFAIAALVGAVAKLVAALRGKK